MHEKIYKGTADRLRRAERVKLLEVERVISLAMSHDIQSVLDVGTGSGLFAEAFHKAGAQVTGIDLNPQMIAAARTMVKGVNFRTGSMEKLPFDDKSFDLCFYGHVLHETQYLDAALAEAFRVTKKKVFVLEWPFLSEETGPPLDHRLKSDYIVHTAVECGFTKVSEIQLSHMVLYLLTI